MRFLLFTLYAPFAAMGEIAVGERRMGWPRPGRSAVLGLVAAALGIRRADAAALAALESGLGFAVRTDATGRPFTDYHTAQVPSARRGQSFATRRHELESANLNTILSTREWRTDALYTIALWPRPNAAVDLDRIAEALRQPRFALYFGRKAGALGLPLDAQIAEAEGVAEAFRQRRRNHGEESVLRDLRSSPEAEIACDRDAPGLPDDHRVERRRDNALNRANWQFGDREEAVFAPSEIES